MQMLNINSSNGANCVRHLCKKAISADWLSHLESIKSIGYFVDANQKLKLQFPAIDLDLQVFIQFTLFFPLVAFLCFRVSYHHWCEAMNKWGISGMFYV